MQKLFRFKYEPCNKTCYAYCSKLMTELRAMSAAEREDTVRRMVDAHNRLCDNPDYSFGVDVHPVSGVFVSHYRSPESTEVFCSADFSEVVGLVCDHVMRQDIPSISGKCRFGDSGAEDLGQEILKFCTDAGYAIALENHCKCKS